MITAACSIKFRNEPHKFLDLICDQLKLRHTLSFRECNNIIKFFFYKNNDSCLVNKCLDDNYFKENEEKLNKVMNVLLDTNFAGVEKVFKMFFGKYPVDGNKLFIKFLQHYNILEKVNGNDANMVYDDKNKQLEQLCTTAISGVILKFFESNPDIVPHCGAFIKILTNRHICWDDVPSLYTTFTNFGMFPDEKFIDDIFLNNSMLNYMGSLPYQIFSQLIALNPHLIHKIFEYRYTPHIHNLIEYIDFDNIDVTVDLFNKMIKSCRPQYSSKKLIVITDKIKEKLTKDVLYAACEKNNVELFRCIVKYVSPDEKCLYHHEDYSLINELYKNKIFVTKKYFFEHILFRKSKGWSIADLNRRITAIVKSLIDCGLIFDFECLEFLFKHNIYVQDVGALGIPCDKRLYDLCKTYGCYGIYNKYCNYKPATMSY